MDKTNKVVATVIRNPEVNARIKALRKEMKMTQTAFAKAVGVKSSSIALIETLRTNPSGVTISSICANLKVRREWITDGTPPMFSTNDIGDVPESLVPKLVDVFSECPGLFEVFSKAAKVMSVSDWKNIEAIVQKILLESEDSGSAED